MIVADKTMTIGNAGALSSEAARSKSTGVRGGGLKIACRSCLYTTSIGAARGCRVSPDSLVYIKGKSRLKMHFSRAPTSSASRDKAQTTLSRLS